MYLKDHHFLEELNAGKITVISDAKCKTAAQTLASPGFSNICDWHSQQNAVKRAGKQLLAIFDHQSDDKWKVTYFRT